MRQLRKEQPLISCKTISAKDAYELGIVEKNVSLQDIDVAIREICNGPAPDKYRSRNLPEQFAELAKVCSPDNVKALLAGQKPKGVADELTYW